MYDTTRGSRSCTHYIFCFLRKDREEKERAVLLEDTGCRSAKRSFLIPEVHTVVIPIPTHTVPH